MFPPLLYLVLLFGLLLCFPLGIFPLPVLALKERLDFREQDTSKSLYLLINRAISQAAQSPAVAGGGRPLFRRVCPCVRSFAENRVCTRFRPWKRTWAVCAKGWKTRWKMVWDRTVADSEGSQRTGKCMYIKAWRNHGLQMLTTDHAALRGRDASGQRHA